MKKLLLFCKNIVAWFFSTLCIVGALGAFAAGGANIAPGVLFLLLGAALLPIAPVRHFWARIKKARGVKTGILAGLLIGAVALMPSADTPPDASGNASVPPSSIVMSGSTADASSAPSSDHLSSGGVSSAPSSDPVSSGSPSAPSSDAISSGNPSSVPAPDSSSDLSSAPETPVSSAPSSAAPVTPVLTGLEVHFIDVGQADAALVMCEGKAMLIDGGNVADSNVIYAYLKKHGVAHLDYIVCTHAHEDHVGGLSGALNFATVGKAFAPVTAYDSDAFRNFVKNLTRRGASITVPSVGQTFALGNAKITVVGPVRASDEPNNTSIVLRMVYGETSFLFTGDAEREEENDILDSGAALKSTVLKVGHHGSETSTSYRFLREVLPDYAVISVGKSNSYGHPTDAVLSRLRDADVKVYRTDLQGDVICNSNGKTVSFTVNRNANADTLTPGSTTTSKPVLSSEPSSTVSTAGNRTYVLNTNTKKFHVPSCRHVSTIKPKNYAEFTGTRAQVIAKGYSPCGTCKP
ncbi:MAG: MBL fold metallo-hydrolase [Clostridia bacterium]|nr:MBL fold metallo-hydrolase [Clostridia bacterium]